MTYSRIATQPVGLTAYVTQVTAGAPPVLRISLNNGSTADLTAADAMGLANYIRDKFPEEILG
ncbi:hypothetical protein SEA_PAULODIABOLI_190 [Microbacterium phage PauloDiaboli]|nr:hypothetical protein SEA_PAULODIABOLI_190 [Microbacterium phage PauloDiaboli]QWY83998.1 hypothetical protein SEA_A3WALLY_191 [Microbacterium phage A3Wally]